MATEYWAHHYYENPNDDVVEDEDFDVNTILDEYERESTDAGAWEEVDLNDD